MERWERERDKKGEVFWTCLSILLARSPEWERDMHRERERWKKLQTAHCPLPPLRSPSPSFFFLSALSAALVPSLSGLLRFLALYTCPWRGEWRARILDPTLRVLARRGWNSGAPLMIRGELFGGASRDSGWLRGWERRWFFDWWIGRGMELRFLSIWFCLRFSFLSSLIPNFAFSGTVVGWGSGISTNSAALLFFFLIFMAWCDVKSRERRLRILGESTRGILSLEALLYLLLFLWCVLCLSSLQLNVVTWLLLLLNPSGWLFMIFVRNASDESILVLLTCSRLGIWLDIPAQHQRFPFFIF